MQTVMINRAVVASGQEQREGSFGSVRNVLDLDCGGGFMKE